MCTYVECRLYKRSHHKLFDINKTTHNLLKIINCYSHIIDKIKEKKKFHSCSFLVIVVTFFFFDLLMIEYLNLFGFAINMHRYFFFILFMVFKKWQARRIYAIG